ncbi:rod opsin, putative [Ixodes scapularis]|uniref:Rod opsin, putative n=1 Tax=Ixodes scapularis TaxID=6945 RepID=B7PJM1_IXOSC|nr:rod opsin, putative [Ixodes scapularis]|eukprot:XP_002408319.1 rod opsin, putative [Ixodes scapularis]
MTTHEITAMGRILRRGNTLRSKILSLLAVCRAEGDAEFSRGSIAALSLERYLALGRPRDPFARLTRSRAFALSLSSWIYALCFSAWPLLGVTSPYVPEGFLTSCSFHFLSDATSDRCFVWIFFVAAWCVPLVFVTTCYSGILVTVIRSRKALAQESRRSELRVAKVSLALVLLWTVAWTPYAIVALLGITGRRNLLTPWGSMAPAMFCKSAAVLDPFVYGLSHPSFRRELAIMLPCLRPRQRPVSLTLRAVVQLPKRPGPRSAGSSTSVPVTAPGTTKDNHCPTPPNVSR